MTVRRFNPSAKLVVLFLAVTVIARSRVPLLPGWTVPLPALLVAAEIVACATVIAVMIIRRRPRRVAAPQMTLAAVKP